ncbi:MAG: N-acetyl sugar amidotransferase [Anaerolineales bacterium]|nr:N-acetyl sugar amidotransferase [Anaerolineales bacterium]
MASAYQMCTICIMDTTDPDIYFDKNGACNHCTVRYETLKKRHLLHPEEGQRQLNQLVQKIKMEGKNKPYDCIIGVSGGVDSTFAAYYLKKLGLRPLAVHLDNGWDSELAVSNIEKFLNKLKIDLYTYVLDWEEFRDLQVSFLRASTSDSEVPTDHAIVATLYRVAAEKNIRYVMSGINIISESILPASWTSGTGDWKYIKGVHDQFGQTELKNYPHYSLLTLFYYFAIKRINLIYLLNYMPYNKSEALKVLENELGWKYYGGKHYESIYTRFFQGYILPRKFNIDKRKAHLSSLIASGQMTREEALEIMQHEPYPYEQMCEDKEYVIKKLDLSEAEFEEIMALPIKKYSDYPNNDALRKKAVRLAKIAQKLHLLPQKISA